MKTKPSEAIHTAFPTCGEVFHFLVASVDLTSWSNLFNDHKTKGREEVDIKAVSDQLRDWATEVDGRAPGREDFKTFIRHHVQTIPNGEHVASVLCHIWQTVLENHVDEVFKNATYLDRNGTRAWYASTKAPQIIHFLWLLQKLFRRAARTDGPMLDAPLDALLSEVWPKTDEVGTMVKHPLHSACFKYYNSRCTNNTSSVDPKTITAWNSGEDRPSCGVLGRHFAKYDDKLGLLLNFAFAGLLEAVAGTLQAWIAPQDWIDCQRLFLGQACCVNGLSEVVARTLAQIPHVDLAGHERLLWDCLGTYLRFLTDLPRTGGDIRDPGIAQFQVYLDYEKRIAQRELPTSLGEFCCDLEDLWKKTALRLPQLNPTTVGSELSKLRAKYPEFCEHLAGPLLGVEARLALSDESPSEDSLEQALRLYQDAFAESCYRAGTYVKQVAREALGLASLLHRRGVGEGSIKPWIKKVLAWWDLLGLGKDFNHEQPNQRIELAELRFTDGLNNELRDRLKSALPQLGLNHWHINGLIGFSDSNLMEKLQATPVDRRQKNPMSNTKVGRDQTALMESIDRSQLDRARELVRNGADLNFINSTGDTCVTKAFAAAYYDLILEILRRDFEPIRRETLLRVTLKKKICGLEQTLSHGRVEILSELSSLKDGRGEVIDMSTERIWNQTPLYYAINCLFLFRTSFQNPAQLMPKTMADSIGHEQIESLSKHLTDDANPNGVLECIKFLINVLRVNVEALHLNGYTALTCAAEARLHDVAVILLDAGANVNHRFLGGGTALVWAIQHDDYEMAKLLLARGADHGLFVKEIGGPIYTMNMTNRMRQLILERR